ncbi:MAG: acyl-CoA dehydrogenase family protein [Geodermatophilaceae bacterium]|nr:acyl-CoA dehydrogenase family protein [Geodermatophilaceae bacterium]
MAEAFGKLLDSLAVDLPLPGSGQTGERWRGLAAIARRDLSVARLAEGHVDAVAILAELGGPPPPPGSRWGVWAAEPPAPVVLAERSGDGWSLTGTKPWCSGAHSCTHALVSARIGEERGLFAVALHPGQAEPVEDTWPAVGMAGSDSGAVTFDGAPAEIVGAPGDYVARPGFWHGAIGVAACWYGGACGVADKLLGNVRGGRAEPHMLAHLGAVDASLHATGSALADAARAVDADPLDTSGDAAALAMRVRAIVEETCDDVLARVGRATGAGPLGSSAEHARRVADLTVYVRQSHAERDLAELGRLVADGRTPSW